MESESVAPDVADSTIPSTIPRPAQRVKLVTRTAIKECSHEKAVEQRKNRFFCMECGFEYRLIRESALRRRTMLR